MLFAKSFAVGLAAALTVCVLWILVVYLLPLFGRFLWERTSNTGSGGVGVVVGSVNALMILVIAVLAFLGGFLWMFRRG